jgi:hypothetical protein
VHFGNGEVVFFALTFGLVAASTERGIAERVEEKTIRAIRPTRERFIGS